EDLVRHLMGLDVVLEADEVLARRLRVACDLDIDERGVVFPQYDERLDDRRGAAMLGPRRGVGSDEALVLVPQRVSELVGERRRRRWREVDLGDRLDDHRLRRAKSRRDERGELREPDARVTRTEEVRRLAVLLDRVHERLDDGRARLCGERLAGV